MFKIARTPCNECLFSTGKIVSDERREDILAECAQADAHFVCHKFTVAEMTGQLSADEANVCCNGFYRSNPEASTWMQIAGRLGRVEFVGFPPNKEDYQP